MVDKEYEEDQEENPESKVQFLQCVLCEDFHLKITDFSQRRPMLLIFVSLFVHVKKILSCQISLTIKSF